MPPKSQNSRAKHRYEPAIGVKIDFETLLQKFAWAGTVRYEKFAEFWREMNMACYCAGRQTKREAREFVEQCFQIAVQFWLPPSSFLVRSGALYLLYGLYYFQLVMPKVKIRVTPEQWQTITEFQEEAREQQHLDLDFVFQKMVLEKAFHYVATSEEVIQNQRGPDDSKIIPESMKEETSMLDDIFSNSALNQLSLVHDQYHTMKLALRGDDASEPDTSLNIVHSDLVSGLYKTLQTHKDRQIGAVMKTLTSKEINLHSELNEKPQVYTPFESLSSQKRLKQKAFTQSTSGYRQRGKHLDHGSDTAESGDNSEKNERDTKYGSGKHRIPGLYEKDEAEDAPVQIPEVHEIFCMPDLDTIVPKPPVKIVSSDEDMDTCSEEEFMHETSQKKGENGDNERVNDAARVTAARVGSTDSDIKEQEEKKARPKRKSEIKERTDSKKLKSEAVDSKDITNSSKKKSNTKSGKKKLDGKKSKAKPNSGKMKEKDETCIADTELESKSRLEENEVEKGEKELTAQEKLQMKLTQRKKEARLKSKNVSKGKRKQAD